MPTEVARTEYGVLIHHDEWNTLELKWLPASKDATEAEARAPIPVRALKLAGAL